MILRNARRVHCALRGRELVAGVHPQVHLETSTTALLLSFHILNQTSNFNSNFKSNLKWNFKSNFEWNIKPQNVCTTSSTQNCNIALSWYWAPDTARCSPDFDKANSLEKGSTSNEDDLKRKLFWNSKTLFYWTPWAVRGSRNLFLKKIIFGWRGSLIRPLMKEMTAGFLVTSKKVWVIILLMEGI